MQNRDKYTFPFSRYPAVRNALFLVAGILIGHYFAFSTSRIILIFGILNALFFIFEWRNKRTFRINISYISSALFLISIIIFGIFRISLTSVQKESPIVNLVKISAWEAVEVSGQIISISETAAGKERWDLEIESIKMGEIQSKDAFKARILLNDDVAAATLGDFVSFTGMIVPISDKRNPLNFDYKSYLASQGISAQISLDKLINITLNNSKFEWVWWREKAIALVETNFTEKTAPIAKALLLGYKQDLDYEAKTAFARAGLSHIMAVSGLHVGFIVAPFWVFIPFLWTKKYGKHFGLLSLLLILFIYAGITGFSASVMRASVMAIFLTFGKLFHRTSDSINITAASAILLLIINPTQLFEIGFQLSYTAVFIILLILPLIQLKMPYWLQVRWYAKPLMAIIVCLVVQFGLYPLQVFYFGEISLISPIANALFVPFLGIVVPLSLIAIIISSMLPAIGLALNYPSTVFLGWMREFVELSVEWEWAWTTKTLSSLMLFFLWMFLIFAISAAQIAALRWKLIIAALATACIMYGESLYQRSAPKQLEVTFFDVGQGDAALVKTPSDKYILIDAGIWSPGYNSGRHVILPHLKEAGITKLDAVILSHPHADHIGGILELIEEIPIATIYNSGYEYESNLYENYLQKAKEKQIPLQELQAGDTLNLDPTMLFLVLGPDGNYHNSDPNEHSVVLNMIYGETEFLFTGDAGEHQEKRLIQQYGSLLDTDLLKVGHHGSRTSSSINFLHNVTPEIAVISLADRNKFKHPHPEAVNRLSTTTAELLFTAQEKALMFTSDGATIKRLMWD